MDRCLSKTSSNGESTSSQVEYVQLNEADFCVNTENEEDEVFDDKEEEAETGNQLQQQSPSSPKILKGVDLQIEKYLQLCSHENDNIKLQGLREIWKLAYDKKRDYKSLLYRNDLVWSMIITIAKNDHHNSSEIIANEIKDAALGIIQNLLYKEELKLLIFDSTDIISICLSAMKTQNKDVQFRGVAILQILSMTDEIRLKLFNHAQIMDLMVEAAQHGLTAEVRETALGYFEEFTVDDKLRDRLCSVSGLVDVLLRTLEKDSSKRSKLRALACIYKLTVDDDIRLKFFNTSQGLIIGLLCKCVLHGGTVDIKETAALTILNMVVNPNVKELMMKSDGVVDSLIGLSKARDSLYNSMVQLFVNLSIAILFGCEKQHNLKQDKTDGFFKELKQILYSALKETQLYDVNWSLDEPLLALRSLSVCYENRKILDFNWLPMLAEAVTISLNKGNSLACECALSILLQYAFDENALALMREKTGEFLSPVKQLLTEKQITASGWTNAIKMAIALDFRLEGSDNNLTSVPSSTGNRLVVILHYYEKTRTKPVASLIEDGLCNNSTVDVWREKYVKDTMVTIVENMRQASAFIILVNHAFYESPLCKMQFQYAVQLNKPIFPVIFDSNVRVTEIGEWLSAGLKGTTIFDISDIQSRNEQIQSIMDKIIASEAHSLHSESTNSRSIQAAKTAPLAASEPSSQSSTSSTVTSSQKSQLKPKVECSQSPATLTTMDIQASPVGRKCNTPTALEHVSHETNQTSLSKRSTTAATPSPAKRHRKIPENEMDVQEWIATTNQPSIVAEALIREGFIDRESISALNESNVIEIRDLLRLSSGALAARLKKELRILFGHDEIGRN
jgi:hypothetical protein